MRHSKRRHKLGVTGPHRSAMLGNLSVALITHGKIRTTLAKAKALRPFIEKIITLAKKAEAANDAARKLHFRRLAISRVCDKQAVAQLFDERVSEFTERNGGYTRIYKLGQRVGDAAEMALIELIDGHDEGYSKRPARKAKKPVEAVVAKDTEASADEASASDAVENVDASAVSEAPGEVEVAEAVETVQTSEAPATEEATVEAVDTKDTEAPAAETSATDAVENTDASAETPSDDDVKNRKDP